MNANERLQMMIGQLMFQIASLQSDLEKAQARIKELEAPAADQPVVEQGRA
jgi:hypothetical protein